MTSRRRRNCTVKTVSEVGKFSGIACTIISRFIVAGSKKKHRNSKVLPFGAGGPLIIPHRYIACYDDKSWVCCSFSQFHWYAKPNTMNDCFSDFLQFWAVYVSRVIVILSWGSYAHIRLGLWDGGSGWIGSNKSYPRPTLEHARGWQEICMSTTCTYIVDTM